jgi:hypothetical protein
MHEEKSTVCYEHMIVASSSSNNDDNMSLGANQEEVPTSTHDVASSSVIPQRRGGVPSRGGSIHLQIRGPLKGQSFNVSLFCFEFVRV